MGAIVPSSAGAARPSAPWGPRALLCSALPMGKSLGAGGRATFQLPPCSRGEKGPFQRHFQFCCPKTDSDTEGVRAGRDTHHVHYRFYSSEPCTEQRATPKSPCPGTAVALLVDFYLM